MRLRVPLILVVDDSEDVRALYSAAFSRAGYRVETAANGNDAIARALARAPDLICLDLAMPHLDGWETAGLIRSYVETRDIPIVAVSAVTDAASVARAIDAGCACVLPKPCLPEDILKALQAVLRDRNEARFEAEAAGRGSQSTR